MSLSSLGRALAVALLPLAAHAEVPGEGLEFFEKNVRPLLATHCYDCHSVESDKIKGDLLLDSRDSILRGGTGGPAMVPGDPDGSLLIETVRYTNPDLQMPPKTRLSPREVADLEKWVAMGAPWPDEAPPELPANYKPFDLEARKREHWSWQPVKDVTPPVVENEAWPLQPLDRFILAKLEAAGLEPAEDADRATWIRRLSFDLRGIPPAVEEVAAFVADSSSDAFEKVVDAFLASPHYGVTWGRHWLDLVRYADGYGHEYDFEIPNAWKYRDSIVRAFNEDVPHDRMVVDAIAGDIVENPRIDPHTGLDESIAATGFWWLGEATHGPTDSRGDEAIRIDNQIDVFSKAFLGLTVSCARCHDHKFDAISDEDYYSLSAYLQSSRRQHAPRDPGGRIAAAAEELKSLQRRASEIAVAATPAAASSGGKAAEAVLWNFDDGRADGWFVAGSAFSDAPSGTDGADVPLLAEHASPVPFGTWHSGLLGMPLHGALRSPTFTLEEREIHLRLAATGSVTVRVVVDGYFMNEFRPLLFEGTRLTGKAIETGGEWQWKTLNADLEKYVGHKVYLEFLDEGDGFIAIDEIAYEPRPVPEVPAMEDRRGLEGILADAARVWSQMPEPDYVLAMAEGTPEADRLHIRGSHQNLGEELPARFLTALGGEEREPAPRPGARLDLARKVVSPENPLTARVQVNRLWHHLTGRGLVPTVDDFGVMGETPSHPELLDWLARRFVETGWSNKSMIREIVLSRTYRMSCVPRPDLNPERLAENDPNNQLLHVFRVKRLTAESIRDGILALSGQLDATLGGPPVPVHLTPFMDGRGKPESGPLDGEGRRSVFLAVRRNFLPPFALAFDFPTPFSTMGRRSRSNVPSQSLALMNDPFVVSQARVWAERLSDEADPESRLSLAFRQAFSREPDDRERHLAMTFLEEHPDPQDAWAQVCHLLLNKKEFIYLR